MGGSQGTGQDSFPSSWFGAVALFRCSVGDRSRGGAALSPY